MKATVDLPESVLAEVREVARQRGWNVRVVFEESLRQFLEKERSAAGAKPYRLRHSPVRGKANPGLTFEEMLAVSGIDRLPE